MELSPSRSNSQFLVYVVSLHSMFFMGALTSIRTQMTNENQSAFEINGNRVFMILAIVALLAVEVTYGLLLCTTISSHCFSILKFMGIFSANLAPFSLMMVLDHAPKHKLILYLLSFVVYAVAITYSCSGVDDDDTILKRSSPISVITYLGLVLVPLALMLVLFAPENLNQIVYPVIYLFLGVEAICFLILYFKFLILSDEKQKPQNFEGYQVIQIQQDKNNDREARYLSWQNKSIKDLEAHLVIKQDKNNSYP